ncbi:MAG: hypothetical protein JRJ47_08050 [Deltaproteobacteria bacterium]|nr:hypothetical protein [Deltaproteobacteria bacterium]
MSGLSESLAGGSIPLALIVILCILGKMKWVAILFAWESIVYGLMLSLICIYAVPVRDPSDILAGSIFYLGSAFIACFLLRLISSESKTSRVNARPDSPKKWLFLVLGIFTSIVGIGGGLALIYVVRGPRPYLASICFVMFVLVSSYAFNHAANIASPERPNLTKWIVVLVAGLKLILTGLILALVLIYALPTEPKVSKPYAAAIAYLGTVIYTCLVIHVASNYVSREPHMAQKVQP